MKIAFAILFFGIALFGALYISLWWGIIQPIYSVCQMVDAHNVSAMGIAGEVVKFLIRDVIAVVWFVVFGLIGKALAES